MKVLLIGSYHCHLERMTIEILNDLGIKTFCTGKFMDPQSPRFDALAAPLNIPSNPALIREFTLMNRRQGQWHAPKLTPEFVRHFDFVITQHCGPHQAYLQSVWPRIRHLPVIHMTYGLQLPQQELFCKEQREQGAKLYMLRFSEKESCIQNYAGTDAAILPWIDENLYKDWNGRIKQIYTAQNWYQSRRRFEAYAQYEDIVRPYNPRLYGIATPQGTVTPEIQKALYRDSRMYFALGSKPSPVTINIFEAVITKAFLDKCSNFCTII